MKRIEKLALLTILLTPSAVHADPWSLAVVDEKGAPIAATAWAGNKTFRTDNAGNIAADTDTRWPGYLGTALVYAPGRAPMNVALKSGANRAVLGAPRALKGRVVDEKGRPLPGVAVRLDTVRADPDNPQPGFAGPDAMYFSDREVPALRARTDAHGDYCLHDVPRIGIAEVSVCDPNWANLAQKLDLSAGADMPDIATRPAARLKGRVVDSSGAPEANRRISASAGGVHATGKTGADGFYDVAGLAAGNVRVFLSDDGQADEWYKASVTVAAAAGRVTPVPDMIDPASATIEIETQPYAPGAVFSLRSVASGQTDYGFPATGKTTRKRTVPGKYELLLETPPKGYTRSDGGEWSIGHAVAAIVAEANKTSQVVVPLVPTFTLHGIARDESGKPLSGVEVRASYQGEVALDQNATTGADGRFTLTGLLSKTLSLDAGPAWTVIYPTVAPRANPDHADINPSKIFVPANGEVTVTLRPVATVTLAGQVVDEAGAPVAGAQVTATVPNRRGDYNEQILYACTDAAGRYALPNARAGAQFALRASKPGYFFMGPNAAEAHAASAVPDRLVLASRTRRARGRVLDSAGLPVGNALVAALNGGGATIGTPPRNIVRTDAAGRFSFSGLPAGKLDFAAGSGTGFVEVRSAAADLGDLVLRPQAPAKPDLALAESMLRQIVANGDRSSLDVGSLAQAFAPYDPRFALEIHDSLLAGSKRATVQSLLFTVPSMIEARIASDPGAARAELPALLPRLDALGNGDSYEFTPLVEQVSSLLPAPEKTEVPGETAGTAALRAWVHRQFERLARDIGDARLTGFNDWQLARRYASLAVMSRRLQSGDADALATKALQIAADCDTKSEEQTPQNEPGTESAMVAETLAHAGAGLLNDHLHEIAPRWQTWSIECSVSFLAAGDDKAALRLANLLDGKVRPAGNSMPDRTGYTFGEAANAVLARMRPRDAAAALALAHRVTAPGAAARALALAARLQPNAAAARLFDQAFALAKTASRRDEREVIEVAMERHPGIARRLFDETEAGVFAPARGDENSFDFSNDSTVPASLMAQVEPGRARVWLEWYWAHARRAAANQGDEWSQPSIAAAMAAADTGRALEMAAEIPAAATRPANVLPFGSAPPLNLRWLAKESILRYLAVPAKARLGPETWGILGSNEY